MPTAKITKKGQLTIPAEFRKKLGTNVVEISMEGDKIVIKPLKTLGGALQKYAKKGKPIEEIMEEEKEVAKNVFLEKYNNS